MTEMAQLVLGEKVYTLDQHEAGMLALIAKVTQHEQKMPEDQTPIEIPLTLINEALLDKFYAWLQYRAKEPADSADGERKRYNLSAFEHDYTKSLTNDELITMVNFSDFVDCEVSKAMFAHVIAERMRSDGIEPFIVAL